MKSTTKTLLATLLLLSPAALSADPATKEKKEPQADPHESKAAADASKNKETETEEGEKAEAKADFEITINGNDQMQFDKKSFEVEAGKSVKLTLKHSGKLPKVAMGHNLVILKKGTNLTTWATKAMSAQANDYIPTDKPSQEQIFAKTKLLGGGESDTITFTAPDAGDYEFLCSFPGHFGVMKGKMTVK